VNVRESDAVLALLSHLDGSQIVEADDLMVDAQTLYASAAATRLHGALPLDEDTLFDTLAEVGQRHADAGR
jgi:hypothetical protein